MLILGVIETTFEKSVAQEGKELLEQFTLYNPFVIIFFVKILLESE